MIWKRLQAREIAVTKSRFSFEGDGSENEESFQDHSRSKAKKTFCRIGLLSILDWKFHFAERLFPGAPWVVY